MHFLKPNTIRTRVNIARQIVAMVFTIMLLLPVFIQVLHACEKHEHKVCDEKTTHLHELEISCDACTFQISSFNYDISGNFDLDLPEFYIVTSCNHEQQACSYLKFNSKQLRAPPIDLN